MQVEFWVPGELHPAARIMLRPVHIGRYKESLVLGENVRLPVTTDCKMTIHKAVCDRAAARQEERADLVLAIASLDSTAGRKPVTCEAFDSATITTNSIAQQEALVRIVIEILIVNEEMLAAEVMSQPFRADGFDAQIHMLQER